jgi:phosphatidylinositol alpha-mannosyltransferase
LRERVVILGMVSEADKVRAYHSVDVFVAPNTGGESFGIVLVEAMAARAVVVASDLPAFRRVLDGGRCGAMFENRNPAALADQVVSLLDDRDRWASLRDAADVEVRQYDWSTVAKRILQVYETVVGERRVGVST